MFQVSTDCVFISDFQLPISFVTITNYESVRTESYRFDRRMFLVTAKLMAADPNEQN